MSECCSPKVPCCGGGVRLDTFAYGPQPFQIGKIGSVPVVATTLTRRDRLDALRVRLNIRRNAARVRPGLYAVGQPDATAPVLVTANYKPTFDAVRSSVPGLDAWILVVDSGGVNVWCAAGKGAFGTAEVVRSVRAAGLAQLVTHRRLILPQLAAPGVAAHEVRAQTGFAVAWGPVRAADLPAFLAAGLKATPEMRRVNFPLLERATLTGVELSVLWRPATLAVAAATALLPLLVPTYALPIGLAALAALLAVLSGAALTPILLPWLPGRMFSLKGAVAGAFTIGALLVAATGPNPPVYAWGLLLAGSALSAFVAMNFTGCSTFTSPSGVEWEMRRALPSQIAATVAGLAMFLIGLWRMA